MENGCGRKILLYPLRGTLRGDVRAGDQCRQCTPMRGLPQQYGIVRPGLRASAVSADPAARGGGRLLSWGWHRIVAAFPPRARARPGGDLPRAWSPAHRGPTAPEIR